MAAAVTAVATSDARADAGASVAGAVVLGAVAVGVRREVAAWVEVVDPADADLPFKGAVDEEEQAVAAGDSEVGDREDEVRAAAATANGQVVE